MDAATTKSYRIRSGLQTLFSQQYIYANGITTDICEWYTLIQRLQGIEINYGNKHI
jgi:hypothetical protein